MILGKWKHENLLRLDWNKKRYVKMQCKDCIVALTYKSPFPVLPKLLGLVTIFSWSKNPWYFSDFVALVFQYSFFKYFFSVNVVSGSIYILPVYGGISSLQYELWITFLCGVFHQFKCLPGCSTSNFVMAWLILLMILAMNTLELPWINSMSEW